MEKTGLSLRRGPRRPSEAKRAIAAASRVLGEDLKNDPSFRQRVARLLEEKMDVTEFIVRKLTNEA